jgi:5'-deoxynucleotidase YfbR-like HD superfamily hydrolase
MIPEKPFSSNMRDVAYIPRWVIARRNRQQYLAEHSYFVTVYADQISRLISWNGDNAELLRYAMYHDLDETITGDIPGPAKRIGWHKKKAEGIINDTMTHKYGWDVSYARSRATEDAKAIVSAADSIDEVCYLCEELLLGNVWVSSVLTEAKKRLKIRWYNLPASRSVLDGLWAQHLEDLIVDQHKRPTLLEDNMV